MTPTVVNKYHVNMKDPDVVYIGRGSKWGNPYSHKSCTQAKWQVESREQAIEFYSQHLWLLIVAGEVTKEELAALQGKRLACYCRPAACHGDVLAKASDWAVQQLTGE